VGWSSVLGDAVPLLVSKVVICSGCEIPHFPTLCPRNGDIPAPGVLNRLPHFSQSCHIGQSLKGVKFLFSSMKEGGERPKLVFSRRELGSIRYVRIHLGKSLKSHLGGLCLWKNEHEPVGCRCRHITSCA